MSEEVWVVLVGAMGLAMFVAGAFLAEVPRVDVEDLRGALHRLAERRSAVLSGAILSATGGGLLLWPVAALSTSGTGDAWGSLAFFSIAVAALTASFLIVNAVLVAALVWRDAPALAPATARLVLDGLHISIWSVSAPLAAVMTVAATVVGVQNEVLGVAAVVAACVKVGTVAVETIGVGRRAGWNAGGWAAGTSGYASVAWYVAVLVALA